MFKFERTQSIFEIGKVKVGRQPGIAYSFIGSIFYEGHRIVQDKSSGLFNRREAERLILVQEEMSEKTGIPYILQ